MEQLPKNAEQLTFGLLIIILPGSDNNRDIYPFFSIADTMQKLHIGLVVLVSDKLILAGLRTRLLWLVGSCTSPPRHPRYPRANLQNLWIYVLHCKRVFEVVIKYLEIRRLCWVIWGGPNVTLSFLRSSSLWVGGKEGVVTRAEVAMKPHEPEAAASRGWTRSRFSPEPEGGRGRSE